jgi:hypothetical protein
MYLRTLTNSRTICGIPRAQLATSLLATWLIVSVPLFAFVVLPVVAPPDAIAAMAPKCVRKARLGVECPGCGLTTAFVRIGEADWDGAVHANAAGIPLFSVFFLNSIIAAGWCLRRLRR